MRRRHLSYLLIAVIIMMALSILPFPGWLGNFRPPWLLLLVLYIQCYLPGYFSIPGLLLLGLCMDVLLATVIGEHAFALLLPTLLLNERSRRFQFFPMGQQIALVALLTLIYQAVITSIDAFLGFSYSLFLPLLSALLAMVFWPWIKIVADDTLYKTLHYR